LYTEIDAAELQSMRQSDGLMLIDVRTDPEVARGVIEGARHIPLHALPMRYEELDKTRTIVFYCQSGARSAQAAGFLAANGFDQVCNLRGGLMGWLRDGMPVVQA
jgi:rhodanese-related sulfurtransferase